MEKIFKQAHDTLQPFLQMSGYQPKTTFWTDIKGYKGLYKISKDGQIKTIAHIIKSKDGNIYHYKEKILKNRLNKYGYVRVALTKNNKTKYFVVHRLVWESFVGKIPKNKEINHIDGYRDNNNLANLELCSHKDNIKHSIKILNHKIGGHNVKTTKVKCIETGVVYNSIKEAAQKTGANRVNLSEIINKTKIKAKNGKYYKKHTSGGLHWEKQ